jgi:hypothetical protein
MKTRLKIFLINTRLWFDRPVLFLERMFWSYVVDPAFFVLQMLFPNVPITYKRPSFHMTKTECVGNILWSKEARKVLYPDGVNRGLPKNWEQILTDADVGYACFDKSGKWTSGTLNEEQCEQIRQAQEAASTK